MIDVLELMKPSTVGFKVSGAQAAAESLRFLSWFAYDSVLTDCLTAMLMLRVSDAIQLIGKANEHAAGLPASVNANEGLAVFCVLARLNELRYVDPALASPPPREEREEVRDLENETLVEIISTLSLRFSMNEIEAMTPEFALLCWQKIREEVAQSRNVIFYSTELGYRRRNIGKDKYRLVPRKSPYTPFWVEGKEMGRPPPVVPRLVSHPEKVIDGMSGRSLAELGEVSV